MAYELLIKGGTLIDPAQKIHANKDVAFANGVVVDVGDDLPKTEAREVLDASGCVVTPGMIDLHVHVFYGVSHYGIEPDPTCIAKGATTVVDAGSAGADTFPGFRKYVIDVSDTRILAQLNISSQGMLTAEIGEFEIPEYANVSKACQMIEQHRDVILGVKVRLTKNSIVSERSGMTPLHRAREAADAAGLPIMVHPQDAWCGSIDDILAIMGERDIVTHCFHAMPCGILDDQGRVRKSVREAMERGVIFDVGHGAGSFSWEVVERAMAQGVQPQTISSDLHVYNLNGPVYDLATVVTKFLHLGMSLDDAIAKVTAVPAETILMSDKIGTLSLGAWGDAVIFELRKGDFQLVDSHGEIRMGNQKLSPVTVIKGGRVYRQNLGGLGN
ncbi:amidohydrolase/deacetylase family metallohydrolase [Candidatus Poribacteria bacterium]|nr:amidohydrolase/deacetylase family metallohydrolase [Candidatus Poribacteria bacterium]